MSSWFLYIYITTFNRGPIVITVSLLHSQTDPYTVICNDYSNCIVINRDYPYNSYVRTMNITASSKSRLPKAMLSLRNRLTLYNVFIWTFFRKTITCLIFIYAEYYKNILKKEIKKHLDFFHNRELLWLFWHGVMHFLLKLHKRIIFVHFYDRVGVLKTFDQNKNISNKLTDDYLSIITPPLHEGKN